MVKSTMEYRELPLIVFVDAPTEENRKKVDTIMCESMVSIEALIEAFGKDRVHVDMRNNAVYFSGLNE